MSFLPQELLDKVIDESYDDISTLVACSLVSHALLPRARTYLFETIYLNTAAQCQRFHALCTSSPLVIQYVKGITVRTRQRSLGNAILSDPSFPALLSLIPVGQLEQLKVDAYDFTKMSESSKESLSLHSFRSATVHTGYISVWKKVADLYTMFKGSRELDLDFHGLLKDTSTPSPLIARQGGSLVKLAVEGYYRSLLQSIIQTGMYPFSVNNLKSFLIKMFDPDEVDDLKEFLDFPLPSLEHLSVSYYSIGSYSQSPSKDRKAD